MHSKICFLWSVALIVTVLQSVAYIFTSIEMHKLLEAPKTVVNMHNSYSLMPTLIYVAITMSITIPLTVFGIMYFSKVRHDTEYLYWSLGGILLSVMWLVGSFLVTDLCDECNANVNVAHQLIVNIQHNILADHVEVIGRGACNGLLAMAIIMCSNCVFFNSICLLMLYM